MHSVFGIGSKRIRTRLYQFRPMFISLSYLIHFQAGLKFQDKKKIKKKLKK